MIGQAHAPVAPMPTAAASRAIRVLLVEDFPITRDGYERIVREDRRLELAGSAGDGVSALAVLAETTPDVMVLDLHLPDMSGLKLLERAAACAPGMRTLVVSASEDADTLLAAVAGGAAGYLTKRASQGELVSAIVAVHEGGSVVTPALAAHLLRHYSRATRTDGLAMRPMFTPRERAIVAMVARGRTDKEIADQLAVSPRTVQNHLASVRDKTGLRRRSELAAWAVEHPA